MQNPRNLFGVATLIRWALWGVMAFAFIAAGPALASDIVLSGSTTCQKRLIEPSASSIQSATGHNVTVRGINSGKGLAELASGKVKASLSSSPLELLLSKAGMANNGTYIENVIVRDTIVPIVHKDNPVTSLTWDQLKKINTGEITNWSELGGPDLPIIVVTSQPTAATRIVFQKLVMSKEAYVSTAREVVSTRQEVDLVGQFKGGIGAVSESFVKLNKGKVIIVGTEEISRPLSIVTKGAPDAEIQSIIDYLRSPAAQSKFI